jgi:hypothetical protein
MVGAGKMTIRRGEISICFTLIFFLILDISPSLNIRVGSFIARLNFPLVIIDQIRSWVVNLLINGCNDDKLRCWGHSHFHFLQKLGEPLDTI